MADDAQDGHVDSEAGGRAAAASRDPAALARENDAAVPPLLVVDNANVVGSVPDGWWRDRRGAAQRLRDALARLALDGLRGEGVPAWAGRPPLEVVLVVEGAARGIQSSDTVRVLNAPGSGDDAIVELVRGEGAGRACLVVTADRELRTRVRELGAEVCGPRTVRPAQ